MARELTFYKSNRCGNVVEVVVNGGGTLVCCGEEMKELKANSTDGANEKHVPVIEVAGNKVSVKVGSVAHPMTEEHHIAFVVLLTEKTVQRVDLDHVGEPVADFVIADDDKVVAAYEYCNLHGLWVARA